MHVVISWRIDTARKMLNRRAWGRDRDGKTHTVSQSDYSLMEWLQPALQSILNNSGECKRVCCGKIIHNFAPHGNCSAGGGLATGGATHRQPAYDGDADKQAAVVHRRDVMPEVKG